MYVFAFFIPFQHWLHHRILSGSNKHQNLCLVVICDHVHSRAWPVHISFAVPLGGKKFGLYAGQKAQTNLHGSPTYADSDTLSSSLISGLSVQRKFVKEE